MPAGGSRTWQAWRGLAAGRRALTALTGALAIVGPLAASAHAQPVQGRPQVIDGPSAAVAGATGLALSVARDGSGGLVYLKQVGGVEHVFSSPLAGGQFQAPQQLDGGLPGPSSQPVIGATNGGLVIVAFVNGGRLFEATRAASSATWGPATVLASGAANPAIQLTYLGKAYVAFTMADRGGYDVRAAYYFKGAWGLEGSPLNAVPADNAGTGGGRPAVAAAGDGVAIVAWGEGGHIYTRRMWGTAPSVVDEQADGPLPGCSEVSADEPSIGSGGDSSYAAVAFHEVLNCGGTLESRVLENKLRGSAYDGISQADGLGVPAVDTADQPAVTVGEYGHGWVTSSRGSSNNVVGMFLGDNETSGGVLQINSEPNASPPDPVPGTAGLYSNLIAWQHDPGAGGMPDIRARYATSGGASLGPELTISSPAQGPADAGQGVAAGGDVGGDAAVAWVQGSPGSQAIVVEQLYQPPAGFAALSPLQYSRSPRALLAWAPPPNSWGPFLYTVIVDGRLAGQTFGTALAVPLHDGRHSWEVIAGNPAGLTSTMAPAQVLVDTVPPKASFTITGTRQVGAPVHISVKATDTLPGVPPSHASGVAKVTAYWGDGSPRSAVAHGRAVHVYRRAGRFKIRVVIADRAGNSATIFRFLRIAPKKG